MEAMTVRAGVLVLTLSLVFACRKGEAEGEPSGSTDAG